MSISQINQIFIPIGTTFTSVPTNYSTGTDWTAVSSPALPANIQAIWVNIAPGTTATLQIDGGGATALSFGNVQTGWFPIPAGTNLTKIYAPANGSTGLVISAVVS